MPDYNTPVHYDKAYGTPNRPLTQTNPYELRELQGFARDQIKQSIKEATYAYGEYVIVVLFWNIEDFYNGLVRRCHNCYLIATPVTDVYEQPTYSSCPVCYGTTFEGGIRAKLVRPVIFATADRDVSFANHGVIEKQVAEVHLAADFTMRTDDLFIRADNGRWQMKAPDLTDIYHGFGPMSDAVTGLGQHLAQVTLEDASSTSYLIPPTDPAAISALLNPQPSPHWPVDFTSTEQINGPLYLPAPTHNVVVTPPSP